MRSIYLLVFLFACGTKDKDDPNKGGPKPSPVAAAGPAADISGKWECMWNVPDGNGSETWMLMQDDGAIRITLTGHDPGGLYTGSATGTIKDRQVELAYKYQDGVSGTLTM